jgi:hypothetical protein
MQLREMEPWRVRWFSRKRQLRKMFATIKTFITTEATKSMHYNGKT